MDPSEAAQRIERATPDDILSELRAQGVTSLDDLVTKSLATAKESFGTMARGTGGGGCFIGGYFVFCGIVED